MHEILCIDGQLYTKSDHMCGHIPNMNICIQLSIWIAEGYHRWLFIYRHLQGSKSKFELWHTVVNIFKKCIEWIICYYYYECHWNLSVHLHVTLILMLGLYWYITVVVAITTISKIQYIYITVVGLRTEWGSNISTRGYL